MKKIIIRCLASVLTVALLAGCSPQREEDPVPTDTQPQTTQTEKPLISPMPGYVTEPPDELSTTETTKPAVSLEPVTRLTCIQWDSLPQFLSLGEGRVLATQTRETDGKITCAMDIIDVYADAVTAHEELKGYRQLVDQSLGDGQFALRDADAGTVTIYDADLQPGTTIKPKSLQGYFSRDLTNFYYVHQGSLYRLDVTGNGYGRMVLSEDLRLESLIGVHPQQDVVVARCYLSLYNENTGICAIDCRTGDYLLLSDDVSDLAFHGENFYAMQTNDKAYGTDIYYGELDGDVLKKAPAGLLGGDTVEMTLLGASGMMVLADHAPDDPRTVIYDFDRVGICSRLERHDYNMATFAPEYLSQEQLIIGAYLSENAVVPVVFDPKTLSYEKSLSLQADRWPAMVDRSIVLQYHKETDGELVSRELMQLREQADTLEEKYGVGIRLGNQTLAYCGSYAAEESDATIIAAALETLDDALSLYPQDFFRQFQDQSGSGGVWFWLTGHMDGPLETVGKAMKQGNRNDLILDIRADALRSTIHHEIWHATELKLSDKAFENWEKTNPEDFLYYSRYDEGYEKLTQWTYDESGDQSYFVNSYSRISAKEDRATLMETVMSTDAKELLKSEALKKKLRLMSDAIREAFHTDDWDTPHWERYI